ncbi:hypothetical protein HDU67_006186 [Dinochytrium kinnereticum]|nr:hypothetical protein HDU67_006186 [Dinochytrium kinnereticum]
MVSRGNTVDEDSKQEVSLTNLQRDLQAQLENPRPLTKRMRRLWKKGLKTTLIIKKGFFASLVALLVESNNSLVQWASMFIEFCQLLSFCFIDFNWGPYGNMFGFILEIIQIEQVVVEYSGPSAVLVLAMISLVLIATMIGLAIYVLRSFINSDFNAGVWPLRLLRTLVSMLASIFFLPIIYTLLGIFTCKPEYGECMQNPLHMTLRVLTAILLPPFLMFTMLMSMTYFHPNPKSTCIIARPTARLELLELTSKLMLTTFFVFAEKHPVLRAVVLLLNVVATILFMIVFIPYYSKSFNVYRFVQLAQVFWGSIVLNADAFSPSKKGSIVMASIEQSHVENPPLNYLFYGYCAGIPFVGYLSYYLYSRHLDYATSYTLAVQNFKVEDTNFNTWEIEEQDKKGQETRFWHPSQVEIATRFLIHTSTPEALEVADQMFLYGIQKFPNSADLMVSYAIFFLVYKDDTSMAANYLKKALGAKPFIDTEFTIYQQEQEIRNGVRTVGNKKLDAVDRVEFKQLMKKATMHHKEAKGSIANFWQTIMLADESQVDTNNLINLVSQMEWSDKMAIDAYRQLLARFPLSVRVLRNYAVFLEEIHNNRDESKKIQKQIKTIQDAGMADELPSVTAEKLALYSHDSRSRKEKKQYLEYRKQVYLYSKANSSQLHWMIRGVQLALIIMALAQLLVVTVGTNFLRSEFEWLRLSNGCRSSLIQIHQSIRAPHSGNLTDGSNYTTNQYLIIKNALDMFRLNSSSLFDYTAKRNAAYRTWVYPNIVMDTFQLADGVPWRIFRNSSMRDTTLLYLRRVNVTFSSYTTAGMDSNPDVRFLLDNGIITLSNAYGKLQFVLADMIYEDVSLISILQLAVTQILFRKYYEPGAVSKEDLAREEEEEKEGSDSDDEFKGKKDADVLNLRAQTGYFKLTRMYIHALSLIAVSYTVAMGANYAVGLTVAPSAGILVSGFNLHHMVSRVATVIKDVTMHGNSTFSLVNPQRPWVSLSTILEDSASQILSSASSILYGNESLGIPLSPLPSQYGVNIIGEISRNPNQSQTVFDSLTTFLENSLRIAKSSVVTSEQIAVREIIRNEEVIINGYNQFLIQFSNDTSRRLDLLINVAIGMFFTVIVVIFSSYFLFWRKILDYLVKTENERTLKLLLMIPVEIVADIDSLRELLHLKRSTVSSKVADNMAAGPNQQIIRSPSHHTESESQGMAHYRRAPGAVRSRPASQAYSTFEANNIIHTRIFSETPEQSPTTADELTNNQAIVANFVAQVEGTTFSKSPKISALNHQRSSFSGLAGDANSNAFHGNTKRSLSSDFRRVRVEADDPPPVPPIPENLRRANSISRRPSYRALHVDASRVNSVNRPESRSLRESRGELKPENADWP